MVHKQGIFERVKSRGKRERVRWVMGSFSMYRVARVMGYTMRVIYVHVGEHIHVYASIYSAIPKRIPIPYNP